jgi:hypothetical protein
VILYHGTTDVEVSKATSLRRSLNHRLRNPQIANPGRTVQSSADLLVLSIDLCPVA